MYKEHLLQNLEQEILLLKQMSALIEERDLDFRPGEKVRSTLELMQYLSGIGSVMLRWLIKNDMTPEVWAEIRAKRSLIGRENFAAHLDEQLEEVRAYMAGLTDEMLFNADVVLPNKDVMKLGAAIINAPIKWLASYRMQLFVNLKLNGRPELGTRDAWYLSA